MKPARLLAGMGFGFILVCAAWFGGWVLPPEGLSRWVAAFVSVYPGPSREAQVAPIECLPLKRLRLYTVCTRDCQEVWRVVMVKGLQVTTLANLGRIPPESVAVTRRRINAAVGREALRLDEEGAREMIACYLRLDGLPPELVLPEEGLREVVEARAAGEEAMRALAERLDDGHSSERIPIERTPEGFESEMTYWNTQRTGQPVLRIAVAIARDGQIRGVRASQMKEPAAE
jgi:hypothetical protein